MYLQEVEKTLVNVLWILNSVKSVLLKSGHLSHVCLYLTPFWPHSWEYYTVWPAINIILFCALLGKEASLSELHLCNLWKTAFYNLPPFLKVI